MLDGPADAPTICERCGRLLCPAYQTPVEVGRVNRALDGYSARKFVEPVGDGSCDVELTDEGRAFVAEYRRQATVELSALALTREIAIGGYA